jgi:hypothetical protein
MKNKRENNIKKGAFLALGKNLQKEIGWHHFY